jgi:hypothetical protein
MRIVALVLTVSLTAATARAQVAVAPPPPPAPDQPAVATSQAAIAPSANASATSGPTLAVTLKFIQDKVNEQGKIVYVESATNSLTGESASENAWGRSAKPAGPMFARAASKKGAAGGGDASAEHFAYTQVVAIDPVSGALSLQEEGTSMEVVKIGLGMMMPMAENWTKTWPVYFKNIEKLEVLSSADYKHRVNPAENYQDDPPYFELVIHMAAGRAVPRHTQAVPSNRHGKTTQSDDSIREFALHFRDEETANRVAKAAIHAIEMCGGGSQPEPF